MFANTFFYDITVAPKDGFNHLVKDYLYDGENSLCSFYADSGFIVFTESRIIFMFNSGHTSENDISFVFVPYIHINRQTISKNCLTLHHSKGDDLFFSFRDSESVSFVSKLISTFTAFKQQ